MSVDAVRRAQNVLFAQSARAVLRLWNRGLLQRVTSAAFHVFHRQPEVTGELAVRRLICEDKLYHAFQYLEANERDIANASALWLKLSKYLLEKKMDIPLAKKCLEHCSDRHKESCTKLLLCFEHLYGNFHDSSCLPIIHHPYAREAVREFCLRTGNLEIGQLLKEEEGEDYEWQLGRASESDYQRLYIALFRMIGGRNRDEVGELSVRAPEWVLNSFMLRELELPFFCYNFVGRDTPDQIRERFRKIREEAESAGDRETDFREIEEFCYSIAESNQPLFPALQARLRTLLS